MPSKDETKRRQKAPRGSGLHFEPGRGPTNAKGRRLGEWVWRRVDPKTGKRRRRRTGQHRLGLALREAQRFDDELRQEAAGVRTYDEWRAPLAPLVEVWIAEQDGLVTDRTLLARRRQVERALEVLGLQVAADLTDLAGLSRRLRGLEGRTFGGRVVTKATLRRTWQNPLRMFSRWLSEDGRYLSRDPLQTWSLVRVPKGSAKPRKAAPPLTIARALKALDAIDAERKREPQRPLWTSMLVTAPRMGAMISRNAADLIEGERLQGGELEKLTRIDFGQGVGNKGRGAGELDEETASEVSAYLDGRRTGPLFLSPEGKRYTRERALDTWQEAYGLALVDELWPDGFPPSLEAAIQVERALRRGRVQVSRGGNPRRVTPETVLARLKLHKLVADVVELIGEEWKGRLIDVHTLRKTHRTWALACGVPAVVIDKQLGHGGSGGDRQRDELAQVLAGSRIGRAHYTDLASDLFDARQSAQAVRALLDDATQRLEEEGTAVLFRRDEHSGEAQEA